MKKLMKTSLDNISIDTLKDGEKKSMNRILRTGAKAGLREDNDRRATLKAIRDSIGPMLDKLENEELAYDFFDAIIATATLANARRIAKHPMCPEDIAAAVEARAAERKSRDGDKPSNDTTAYAAEQA